MSPAWVCAADGLRLAVRVTPRAACDRVDGLSLLSDGRSVLAVRLRAVPDRGAANAALCALLADALALPKSSVRVVGGHTARLKQVGLAAPGAAERGRIAARLASLAGTAPATD